MEYSLSPYSPTKDDYPAVGVNVFTPSKFDDQITDEAKDGQSNYDSSQTGRRNDAAQVKKIDLQNKFKGPLTDIMPYDYYAVTFKVKH